MEKVHNIRDLAKLQDKLDRESEAIQELLERITCKKTYITVSAGNGYNIHNFEEQKHPEVHAAIVKALTDHRNEIEARLTETRTLVNTLSDLVKGKEF